jgi:tetratricopeptide (TPR) repeat protein
LAFAKARKDKYCGATIMSERDETNTAVARAAAAQAQGDWTTAIRAWQACLSRWPDHPSRVDWLEAQGLALVEAGQFAAAYENWQELVATDPYRPTLLVGLAHLAERNKEWNIAASYWERCLAQFSGHGQSVIWTLNWINALISANRVVEVISPLQQLADEYPNDLRVNLARVRIAFLGRRWSEMVTLCDACFAAPDLGDNMFWVRDFQGYALVELGNYDRAAEAFTILLSELSQRRRGHAGLAAVAGAQWKWRDAIEHWDQALQNETESPLSAWAAEKARALVEIGEVEQARQAFAELAARHPDDVLGLRGLAEIATSQDEQEVALAGWDECVRHFPESPVGVIGKARLLFDRGKYDEAGDLVTSAAERWPASPEIAVLAGRCAQVSRGLAKAAPYWQKIPDDFIKDRSARRAYSYYLGQSNQRDSLEALSVYLSNDHRSLYECQLEFELGQENYLAAIKCAQLVLAVGPRDPSTRLHLAMILLREGSRENLESALDNLNDLLGTAPDAVSLKVVMAEALIRAHRPLEAIQIIDTVPLDEQRVDVVSLRVWSKHCRGDATAAKRLWRKVPRKRYFASLSAPIHALRRIDNHRHVRSSHDIILFAVVRNEAPRLAWFLSYYRALGVDRFVFVDNDSSDGTIDILKSCSDVILYQTSDRYDLSGLGMRWINELIVRHGTGCWCLQVDADEALVFPRSEEIGLRGLTRYMSLRGDEAIVSAVLDMYPATATGPANQDDTGVTSYVYFDSDVDAYATHNCPYREVFGGIRRRLFGVFPLLSNVPMILGGCDVKYLLGRHHISPALVSDVTAVILHYHLLYLLADAHRPRLLEAIDRGQHSGAAVERRRYLEKYPDLASGQSLLQGKSVRYRSSAQLLELGLLQTSDRYGSL